MIRDHLLLLACGAFAGFCLGQLLPIALPPLPEDTSPAIAVRQQDGSLVAPRAPAQKPSPPPHALPRGSREQRRIAVTVQPKEEDCPPLRLDLSLVEQDGGRRVVASSPDGSVTHALDMPLQPELVPAPRRNWAAGASLDLDRTTPGLWLERDLGRFRLGAELLMDDGGAIEARGKIGFTF